MVLNKTLNFIKSKLLGLDTTSRNKALAKCREEVEKLRLENSKLKEKVTQLQKENEHLREEQNRFGMNQNYEVEFFIDFLWSGYNSKGKETKINAYFVLSGVVESSADLETMKKDLQTKEKIVSIMTEAGFKNVDKDSEFTNIQVGDNTSKTSKTKTENLTVDYIIDDTLLQKNSLLVKSYKNKSESIKNYTK